MRMHVGMYALSAFLVDRKVTPSLRTYVHTYVCACVTYFLEPNPGASAHGTARKTISMAMSPMKIMRNRKKQAAATTIASMMMMNAASRKLLKKKTVNTTMVARIHELMMRQKMHSLLMIPTVKNFFSHIYAITNARVGSMGRQRTDSFTKGAQGSCSRQNILPVPVKSDFTPFFLCHCVDALDGVVEASIRNAYDAGGSTTSRESSSFVVVNHTHVDHSVGPGESFRIFKSPTSIAM